MDRCWESKGQRNPSAWCAALALGLMITIARPVFGADEALPRAKPETVGMSSERLQRLSQRMQQYIDKGQVAGVVTLLARQGKVVHYEAQGYRNREDKLPMQKDDIFVIMSMTKPIASTALMMLHEEGKFRLSDPISKWLPEFDKMQVRIAEGESGFKLVPARPITVRHVLTHTAGLARGTGTPASASPATTLRERVKRIAAAPLSFNRARNGSTGARPTWWRPWPRCCRA